MDESRAIWRFSEPLTSNTSVAAEASNPSEDVLVALSMLVVKRQVVMTESWKMRYGGYRSTANKTRNCEMQESSISTLQMKIFSDN